MGGAARSSSRTTCAGSCCGSTTWPNVPFEETVRRNAARGFTPEEMLGWWAPDDHMGTPGEWVLTAPGVEDAVSTILHTSGLAGAAALTPCPARCPRCGEKGRRLS